MKNLKVLSLAIVAGLALGVDAATVFQYQFEDTLGKTFAVNDTLTDAVGGAAAVVKKASTPSVVPKIAAGPSFRIHDPVANTTYASTSSFDVSSPTAGKHYYIEIPSREAFNGSAFTIEGFFKMNPTMVATQGGIWSARFGLCFFRRGTFWRFGTLNGDFWSKIDFSAGGVSGTSSDFAVPGTKARYFEDGLWHHVAAVYDGANFKCYLDKQLVSTIACGAIDYGENCTEPILVGDSGGSNNCPFPGLIDEVRYTDAALTPSQFLEPAYEVADGEAMGWWRFEEMSSDCVKLVNSVDRNVALISDAGTPSEIVGPEMKLTAGGRDQQQRQGCKVQVPDPSR